MIHRKYALSSLLMSTAAVVVAEAACVKDTVLEVAVHCGARRGNQAGLM